ncbi:MAG: polysaccharide biosynthesis protein GumN [Myxococcaceae bacterium]|nr:polysaccharide biosynthesis protein GumN [Myxococcaceae bacterium]
MARKAAASRAREVQSRRGGILCAAIVVALLGCACSSRKRERSDEAPAAAQVSARPAINESPRVERALDGPDAANAMRPESADPAWVRPFLWRVDVSPPSYLFGTIHVPDARLAKLPRDAEWAYAESTVVATEVALDGGGKGDYLAHATLPRGTRFEGVVPPTLLDRTRAAFAAAHQPFAPMSPYKPWFVAVRVSMLDHMRELSTGTALDKLLYRRAAVDGKALDPLETTNEQGAIFDALDDAEQVTYLERTLDSADKSKREHRDPILALLAAYLAGDETEIDHELYRDYDAKNAVDVKVMKRLVDDRNVVLADRLVPRLASGKSYFVAVGTAHLVGPRSVVALLRKRGVHVERVADR